MMTLIKNSSKSLRDVLYDFSLAQEVPDADLLDEYAKLYPSYAVELTEFAIDMFLDAKRGTDEAVQAFERESVSPAVSRAMSAFQVALQESRGRHGAAVSGCRGGGRAADADLQALALLDPKPGEVKPPVSDFASSVGLVATTICKDDDLAWTWHCQIAMAIQDQIGSKLSHAEANHCAARAMKMLFGADVEKTKHWNITVKPQPAEDPEEWVEITNPEHVYRRGIDWVSEDDGKTWFVIDGWHGSKFGRLCRARCRRKDLPKPAKPKRTVTVPKWLCFSSSTGWSVVEQENEPSSYNAVHRVGETTYTEQEDGTWIES